MLSICYWALSQSLTDYLLLLLFQESEEMMTLLRSTDVSCMSVEEVQEACRTHLQAGLSDEEAKRRHTMYGPNDFEIAKEEPLWRKFLGQVSEDVYLCRVLPCWMLLLCLLLPRLMLLYSESPVVIVGWSGSRVSYHCRDNVWRLGGYVVMLDVVTVPVSMLNVAVFWKSVGYSGLEWALNVLWLWLWRSDGFNMWAEWLCQCADSYGHCSCYRALDWLVWNIYLHASVK